MKLGRTGAKTVRKGGNIYRGNKGQEMIVDSKQCLINSAASCSLYWFKLKINMGAIFCFFSHGAT
jgi:hypothetical protein